MVSKLPISRQCNLERVNSIRGTLQASCSTVPNGTCQKEASGLANLIGMLRAPSVQEGVDGWWSVLPHDSTAPEGNPLSIKAGGTLVWFCCTKAVLLRGGTFSNGRPTGLRTAQ